MTYQAPGVVTAALTAATQLTDFLFVRGGAAIAVSVAGTFTGTVQLRRTLLGARPTDATASGIKASFAAPTETSYFIGANAWFFLYASALSAGTANVALRTGQEDGPRLFQPQVYTSAVLDALDEATDPVLVRGGGWVSAQRLAGAFTGTVVLERSFDGGSTWGIVDADVVNEDYQMGATCLVRCRCSAYTSGSASIYVAVGQGC